MLKYIIKLKLKENILVQKILFDKNIKWNGLDKNEIFDITYNKTLKLLKLSSDDIIYFFIYEGNYILFDSQLENIEEKKYLIDSQKFLRKEKLKRLTNE